MYFLWCTNSILACIPGHLLIWMCMCVCEWVCMCQHALLCNLCGSIFDRECSTSDTEQYWLGPGDPSLQEASHIAQTVIWRQGSQLPLHWHSGNVLYHECVCTQDYYQNQECMRNESAANVLVYMCTITRLMQGTIRLQLLLPTSTGNLLWFCSWSSTSGIPTWRTFRGIEITFLPFSGYA